MDENAIGDFLNKINERLSTMSQDEKLKILIDDLDSNAIKLKEILQQGSTALTDGNSLNLPSGNKIFVAYINRMA